jgi:midasin
MKRESLARGPLAFITRENASQIPIKTLHILLLAYLRLLEACDRLYEKFYWPVLPLQSLCEPPHPDVGVRLLAVRCFAHHVGMNEPARMLWEEKVVGTPDNVDPLIDTGFGDTVDGWTLPILEHKRIIDERDDHSKLLLECKGPITIDAGSLGLVILIVLRRL